MWLLQALPTGKAFFIETKKWGGVTMKVNGKVVEFKNNKTVLDLLNDHNLNKDRVVVEINLEIVENEQYENYGLKEHDAIEIISFIGGGWFENIC